MMKYRLRQDDSLYADFWYLERKTGWFFWEKLGAGKLKIVEKKLAQAIATGSVEPKPWSIKDGHPVFPPCRLIGEGLFQNYSDIPWWTDERH